MEYDMTSVVIWEGSVPAVTTVTAGNEPTVHSWLHPTTTDHTGHIVIHINPQYKCYLSIFRGNYKPLMMVMTC
jgi:hypothetical protein